MASSLPPPLIAPSELELSSLPLVQGTVRWFNAEKGWGFVAPNAGFAGYGQDAFVHQNQLQSDGFRTLDTDQVIEYRLRISSDKGKHIAMAVTAPGGGKLPAVPREIAIEKDKHRVRDGSRPPPGDRGDRDRGGGGGGGDFHHHRDGPPPFFPHPPPAHLPAPYFGAHPGGPPGAAPPYDHRNARPPHAPFIVGVVKNFDLERGWGFLLATASPAGLPLPPGDVFVHQSQVHMEGRRELGPGMTVEFSVGIDEKNNKPIATHVTAPGGRLIRREDVDDAIRRAGGGAAYGSREPERERFDRYGGPPPPPPHGGGPGGGGGAGGGGRRDDEINARIVPKDARWYKGTVFVFDLPKKYGFIQQPDGSSLFLHASRIDIPAEDIVKGLQVEYQIVRTSPPPPPPHSTVAQHLLFPCSLTAAVLCCAVQGVDPKGKDAAVNIRAVRQRGAGGYGGPPPPSAGRLSPGRGPPPSYPRDPRALSPGRRFDERRGGSPPRRAGFDEWERERDGRRGGGAFDGKRSPLREYGGPSAYPPPPSSYPPPSSNPHPPPPQPAPRDFYDPYRADPRYAAAPPPPPPQPQHLHQQQHHHPAAGGYAPPPHSHAPPIHPSHDAQAAAAAYYQQPPAAAPAYHYPPPAAAPSAAPYYGQPASAPAPANSYYPAPPPASAPPPGAAPQPSSYPFQYASAAVSANGPAPSAYAPPPSTASSSSSGSGPAGSATDPMLAHLYSLYSTLSNTASSAATTAAAAHPTQQTATHAAQQYGHYASHPPQTRSY